MDDLNTVAHHGYSGTPPDFFSCLVSESEQVMLFKLGYTPP
jgi:hypothetical protein